MPTPPLRPLWRAGNVMSRRYALLAIIFLLNLVEFLQIGMVSFAAAPIRGEIDASPEEYSFIAALYACVAVVMIAKKHWFIERMGLRHYVHASIVVHIAGCLMCAASHDLGMFTAGRVIMALGGAAFMTTARVLVHQLPAGSVRFGGVKAFFAGLAVGTGLAPLLASLAVTEDHWQTMFWLLIAVTVTVAILACRCLPADDHADDARSPSNLGRILLLAVASFFLLYLLQRSYYNFYDDRAIFGIFCALAGFALYSYFHAEHRNEKPLLMVRELWQRPRFVFGVAVFSFAYVVQGANNFILPAFLQTGMGYAWETIGKQQSLGLAMTVVTWAVMLRIINTHPGSKKFHIAGFIALGSFAWLLAHVAPDTDLVGHILPALALNGCFIMLVIPTTAIQAFADVAHDDKLFAHAQQVKNMLREIFTALGTCLATLFSQWRSTEQYNLLNLRLTHADAAFGSYVDILARHFGQNHESAQAGKMALIYVGQQVNQQISYLVGIEYFTAIAVLAVVCTVLIAWQNIFR